MWIREPGLGTKPLAEHDQEEWAVATTGTADNCDARHRICDGPSPGDSTEDDIETGNVCASEGYSTTLHSPVKDRLNLTLKGARLLRYFIVADDVNSSNLQLLGAAIDSAVTGVRGRARDDTPITANVRLWRRLAINDCAVEQQLFKAYVRSQRVEKLGVRDITYVRMRYELGEKMVGGYA